jgi:hypothetical protein
MTLRREPLRALAPRHIRPAALNRAPDPSRIRLPRKPSAVGIEGRTLGLAATTQQFEHELRRARVQTDASSQPGQPRELRLRRGHSTGLSRSTSSSGNPSSSPSSIRRHSNAVCSTSGPKTIREANERANCPSHQSRQVSSPEGPSTCTTKNLNSTTPKCSVLSVLQQQRPVSLRLRPRKPRKVPAIIDSEESLGPRSQGNTSNRALSNSNPEGSSLPWFRAVSLPPSL